MRVRGALRVLDSILADQPDHVEARLLRRVRSAHPSGPSSAVVGFVLREGGLPHGHRRPLEAAPAGADD